MRRSEVLHHRAAATDDGAADLTGPVRGAMPVPAVVWVRMHSRERLQRKLRISLTDRCNYACFFCHNEGQGPIQRISHTALRTDEIQAVVRVALAEGVTRIKLTGGEPLLYRCGPDDIVALVRRIAQLRDEHHGFDLSMTTNGSLLAEYAEQLAAAGLDRVTMSMTTLHGPTFDALIAPNRNLLARSLAGLWSARQAGLTPLKINAVIYHSTRWELGNLDEIHDLYRAAVEHRVEELRFFTLLWHESFARFDEFYHFFSGRMRDALEALLGQHGLVDPHEVVEILSALALRFARRAYPKIEFGLVLDQLRLGFEAMKYGRLSGDAGLQEGPYAMRLSADGALRATLNGAPSYALIQGIRAGLSDQELRYRYRAALEEMP